MASRCCCARWLLIIALVFTATIISPASAYRRLPESHQAAAQDVFQSIYDQRQEQHHHQQQQQRQNNNVDQEHRRLHHVDHDDSDHDNDNDDNDHDIHSKNNNRELSLNMKYVEVPLPANADEHLVASLPLLSEGVFPTKHWAGLLPASPDKDKFLFYWLFAPDTSMSQQQATTSTTGDLADNDIALLIWLNGGPGCSSMDGLFLENGPLRFELKDGTGNFQLVPAKDSWHRSPAYTLYIDQPVGTGLSFSSSNKYPRNDKEVNTDFYYFLQSFLKVHADKFVTEDKKLNRPLYFSGESHAGHYIPSMIAYILDQNDNIAETAAATDPPADPESTGIYVGVSGAAIGNGWIDPFHQYAAAEAAYGHGIIGRAQMVALQENERKCQDALNQKRYSSGVCFDLLDSVVSQSYGSKSQHKVSQYDIRKVESQRGARTFPPGHKTVETYLGGIGAAAGMSAVIMKETLEAIHATPSREAGQIFQECTDPPYNALSHQDGLGVVNEVVKILEHDTDGPEAVRLLFFNGVTDLICNHVGNEILLEKMPWSHNDEWTKAKRAGWKSKSDPGDKISGYIKEFKNLLFLKVMDSGHMVPMDKPELALDMMKLFMYGGDGAFQFSPQNLNRALDVDGQCETCPTCPTNTTNYDRDSTSNAAVGPAGAASNSTTTQIWAAVGLAAVFLVGLFVFQRRRYGARNLVATYDLEMRGGTYYDDPPEETAGAKGS